MENSKLIQEHEVDLREYIKIIIKRKDFILNILLISVISTAVVSLLIPKVYEVSMIIEPPVMAITDKGIQDLDTVDNIQAKINAGAYSEKIIEGLTINNPYKSKKLEFKVLQPIGTRLIKISLEEKGKTTGLGIELLNKLLEELRSDYKDIIDVKKYEFDHQIALRNSQISTKENGIALKEEQLVLQAEREAKLFDEMREIKSNADRLADDRKSLLQAKDAQEGISSLLYMTTVQQDMAYSIQLQDELTHLRVDDESAKAEAKNFSNDINDLRNEIEKDNMQKEEIRNVVLVQEPQVSLYAIKPNIMQNILVSAVVGLFLGMIFAFFMEFWKKES